MCNFGGAPKDDSAARAAAAEAERRSRIAQGTQSIDAAFSGFNPDYYTGLTDAYSNYAAPQLDEQYKDAAKKLNFALSRSGLSASTAAADQQRKLEEKYNKYKTQVSDAALNYGRSAQSDIENTRAQLLSQLNATEDPAAAAAAATRRAEFYSKPPTFDPIGSFVFDVGQALDKANADRGYTGLVSSPLFSNSSLSNSYVVKGS